MNTARPAQSPDLLAAFRRLGEAVRHERRARGWTQARLAREAALSRRSISNVENGRIPADGRTPSSAIRIAVAFGWLPRQIDVLLGEAGAEPEPPPESVEVQETLDDIIRDIEASPALSRREKRLLIAQVEIIKQDREGWE